MKTDGRVFMSRYRMAMESAETASVMVRQMGRITGRECMGDHLAEKVAEFEKVQRATLAALSRIGFRHQEMLRMVYIDGLTIEEAGEKIGVSRTSAYRVLNAAIYDLEKILNETNRDF
jgi:DNA-directed RNA polymerase specialized sigma24 family protein|nr:MAG TPA: Putative TetR-family transcriptional regulator [Caudoviricetes sp.]